MKGVVSKETVVLRRWGSNIKSRTSTFGSVHFQDGGQLRGKALRF